MEGNNVHEELFEDEREEAEQVRMQQSRESEDRVRRWVYPLICSLGGFQTIAGKRIYLANPSAGKSLKTLSYKMWNQTQIEQPFIWYYLLEWNFVNDNLLPLIQTQKEDKKMLSEAMRLLLVLSEDFSSADLANFILKEEFLKKREGLVELLCNKPFLDLLVQEVEICASAGNNILESQNKMLGYIFGTLLNLLHLNVDQFLPKITSLFATEGGLFDSMVYLTQNASVKKFRQVFMNICCIVSRFTRHVTPQIVFGGLLHKDPEFKRRMDIQKLITQRRKRNVISSRHSRFGAMIAVKRSDNTSLIVSNPNALRDRDHLKALNQRQGQLKKRLFGTYQQSVYDKRHRPQLAPLTRKKQADGTVVHHLKAFLKEFFAFGFANLATHLEQALFSPEMHAERPSEGILVFIELMTFVMESVLTMR